MKAISMVLMLASLTACSGSTYVKNGDVVEATGWAAVAAASANTSHREECIGGCRNPPLFGVQGDESKTSPLPYSSELSREASREVDRALSREIRSKIAREVRSWFR